jgi:hypothetical protein
MQSREHASALALLAVSAPHGSLRACVSAEDRQGQPELAGEYAVKWLVATVSR